MVHQLIIVHKEMQTTSKGQICCEATQNITLLNKNITELVTEKYSEIRNDEFHHIHSVFEFAHMGTCTCEMLHHTNLLYLLFSLFLYTKCVNRCN